MPETSFCYEGAPSQHPDIKHHISFSTSLFLVHTHIEALLSANKKEETIRRATIEENVIRNQAAKLLKNGTKKSYLIFMLLRT